MRASLQQYKGVERAHTQRVIHLLLTSALGKSSKVGSESPWGQYTIGQLSTTLM